MIGLDDAEGRTEEKRKLGTRTKEKGGHQEEKGSLGLDPQRHLTGESRTMKTLRENSKGAHAGGRRGIILLFLA